MIEEAKDDGLSPNPRCDPAEGSGAGAPGAFPNAAKGSPWPKADYGW